MSHFLLLTRERRGGDAEHLVMSLLLKSGVLVGHTHGLVTAESSFSPSFLPAVMLGVRDSAFEF